jgi:hypothetical protein
MWLKPVATTGLHCIFKLFMPVALDWYALVAIFFDDVRLQTEALTMVQLRPKLCCLNS